MANIIFIFDVASVLVSRESWVCAKGMLIYKSRPWTMAHRLEQRDHESLTVCKQLVLRIVWRLQWVVCRRRRLVQEAGGQVGQGEVGSARLRKTGWWCNQPPEGAF